LPPIRRLSSLVCPLTSLDIPSGQSRSLEVYSFPVPDSYAGHVNDLDTVPSYVWGSGGVKVTETVTWSRVRYTGYSFLAVDVQPAEPGRETTLTLRAVTENGTEIDRVVLSRTASGQRRAALNDTTA
jgi:hypothetical protein